MGNPRADWCYRTEPEPGLNGRVARLSARPGDRRLIGDQRHDLHARPGGRLRSLAPARQCRLGLGRRAALLQEERGSRRADDELHGVGRRMARRAAAPPLEGPRSLSARRPPSIGIPPTDDFNRGDNEGTGYFEVNQRRGVRWSAARAFLKPALGRPNLTLWTGAQATRLLVEGGRVDRARASPPAARPRPSAPGAR